MAGLQNQRLDALDQGMNAALAEINRLTAENARLNGLVGLPRPRSRAWIEGNSDQVHSGGRFHSFGSGTADVAFNSWRADTFGALPYEGQAAIGDANP